MKKNYFKADIKIFVLISLFSIIFISLFNHRINQVVRHFLLPTNNIIIEIDGNINEEDIEVKNFLNIERIKNFKLLNKFDLNYNYIKNIEYQNNITLINTQLINEPNTVIIIKNKEYNFPYKICYSDKSSEFLYIKPQIEIDNYQTDGLYIFPFRNNYLKIFITLIIYFILYVFIFLLFYFSYYLLFFKLNDIKFFFLNYNFKYFLYVWLFLYIYALMNYYIGIPNFVKIGDQYLYFTEGIFTQLTWRGYITFLLAQISRFVEKTIFVKWYFIYFLFSTLNITYLSMYLLPQLYILANKKTPKNLQVFSFLLIIIIFWHYTITAVMSDMYAITFFISFIYFYILYFKNKKIKNLIISSMSASFCCNFRVMYLYSMIIFIFLFTIEFYKTKKIIFKNIFKEFLIFISIFLFVSTPQLLINLYTHQTFNFLPFSTNNDFIYHSVITQTANHSIKYGMGFYPFNAYDNQIINLKLYLYNSNIFLSMAQLFDVFISNPLGTLIMLVKKVFFAIDLKLNIGYPNNFNFFSEWTKVFSFFNYFIILTAIYTFIKKIINKNEFNIIVLLFISLSPILFSHVEYRYYLLLDIILYYLFSYKFIYIKLPSKTYDTDKFLNRYEYLTFLLFGMILYFCFYLSFNIY